MSALRPVLALAVCAGLTAATGVASAAKTPPCATWTDPAGDAVDGTFDITKVTWGVTGKDFVVKLAVPGYAAQHAASYGDRFTANMNVDGADVIVYYQQGQFREQEANAFYQAGISVDGEQVDGTETDVTETIANGVVTLKVPVKVLGSAIGTKLTAKTPVTDISSQARGTYVALLNTQDEAAAPASTAFTFAACK